MKRSPLFIELITAKLGRERIGEALQRPASVQRLCIVLVLVGMTVVLWAFPSLSQRENHFGNDELGDRFYLPPDDRTVAYHRQSLVKARVAQDVLDGRKTFGDAVAAFRELHAVGPQRGSILQFYHPGCSEEEALRWNVVAFLRSAIRERPEKAAQVERIEQELSRAGTHESRG